MENTSQITLSCVTHESAVEIFRDFAKSGRALDMFSMYVSYAQMMFPDLEVEGFNDETDVTTFIETDDFGRLHDIYMQSSGLQTTQAYIEAHTALRGYVPQFSIMATKLGLRPELVTAVEAQINTVHINLVDPLTIHDDYAQVTAEEPIRSEVIDLHALARRWFKRNTQLTPDVDVAYYWPNNHHIMLPIIGDEGVTLHGGFHELTHSADVRDGILGDGSTRFGFGQSMEYGDTVFLLGSMFTEAWAEHRTRRMLGMPFYDVNGCYNSEIVALEPLLQHAGEALLFDVVSPECIDDAQMHDGTYAELEARMNRIFGADFLFRYQAWLAIHGLDSFAAMRPHDREQFCRNLPDISPDEIVPTLERANGPIPS